MKLEFTKEQLVLIQHLASQAGKSQEAWVQAAVLSQIPRGTQEKLTRESQAKAMMGAVFNHLDAQDREHPSEAAMPVAEPARPAPVVESNMHSCFYLSPEQLTQYQGQCSGTCHAPSQYGRVCFWSSVKAKECPVFKPRMFKRR